MSVFLVLSSLGVAFYVFVLLALYRETRKQRTTRDSSHAYVNWDGETGKERVFSAAGQAQFPGDVRWVAVTRLHWAQRTRSSAVKERTLVAVTAPHITSRELKGSKTTMEMQ